MYDRANAPAEDIRGHPSGCARSGGGRRPTAIGTPGLGVFRRGNQRPGTGKRFKTPFIYGESFVVRT